MNKQIDFFLTANPTAELRELINTRVGGLEGAAHLLSVTPNTVRKWIKHNPENFVHLLPNLAKDENEEIKIMGLINRCCRVVRTL